VKDGMESNSLLQPLTATGTKSEDLTSKGNKIDDDDII
jgi:hypothetical protein